MTKLFSNLTVTRSWNAANFRVVPIAVQRNIFYDLCFLKNNRKLTRHQSAFIPTPSIDEEENGINGIDDVHFNDGQSVGIDPPSANSIAQPEPSTSRDAMEGKI